MVQIDPSSSCVCLAALLHVLKERVEDAGAAAPLFPTKTRKHYAEYRPITARS